ncbi:LysR family transcriptional regulator [Rhodococcus sp. NPDC058521]|uniref:LysR family transcriptional regulator n=1 Tax=Rhodococcus sp. NPDC058521 TaxID=3346536 RepID=UPI00366400B3
MDEWLQPDSLHPVTSDLAPLLGAFVAVAEEGHVTRAADVLGVPQSSLSRRLRAVQKTLGLTLFTPAGRRIVLTPQGRELLERIREPVRALDDAVVAVLGNADPDGGLVRFGFPLTMGPISVPALLAEFHEEAPRIRLHLVQAHGDGLADLVRKGRLDLAVMIPAPDDLPSTPIGRQRIGLVVSRGHRLATRTRVDPSELVNEPFVANPPSYHLRQLTDSWCAEAGFEPDVAFEITEFDTLRSLVARGMGVALLPDAEVPHPDIVTVPLVDAPDRSVALVSGNGPLSPAAARLHRHLALRACEWLTSPETP